MPPKHFFDLVMMLGDIGQEPFSQSYVWLDT